MPAKARGAVLALAVAALLAAVPAVASGAAPAAQRSTVAVIVLENHEYDQVIGDPDAPFLNRMARTGALATSFYGVTHPSLPNYIAMLGGSTFGIDHTCSSCSGRGNNLALQLSRRGVPWRAYFQGLPRRCDREDHAGRYVRRHNPFLYYPSIAASPRRCAHVVPMRELARDLRRDRLPAFAWIGPDLCDSAHDCSISSADEFVARMAPRLARHLGPNGYLIVTFDEGTSHEGCCGRDRGGGHIATILHGAPVRRGARVHRPMNHYSLLATLEDRFRVPRLREARGAPTLRAALRRRPGAR